MVHFQNALIFPTFSKEMKDAPSALLSYISTRELLRTRERFRKLCAEGECFLHFSSVFKNSRVPLQLKNTRGTRFFYFFFKIYVVAIFDVYKIGTRLKPRQLFSHNVVLKNFVSYFKEQTHC